MAINVTCPSCHARFTVGDQHAGKTGPCPKCKAPIEIPKLEDQVVIHAPEAEPGSVDAKGKSVLKPIRRKEAKFSVNVFAVTAGLVILSVAIAWLLRNSDLGDNLFWVLTAGAVLLGPPLAYAGYSFLKDPELGAYTGNDLALRSLACGLIYALLWGVYLFVANQMFGPDQLEAGLAPMWIGAMIIPIALVGGGAALVCFDFDMTTGFFHYALYLLATVVLRAVMGLAVLPGLQLGGA